MPQRILSTKTAAKRIGISNVSLGKHVRHGVIEPDYIADSGYFFKSESLPALRIAIAEHKQKLWRHCASPRASIF